MGLTVREVVERTQSEYLFGGGVNLPAWTTLTDPIAPTAMQIVLGTRNVFGSDDVLEFDDDSGELAITSLRSGTTYVLQERGYLETEAAAHAAGTRVIANNPYPKHLLLQSLQGLIGQLYGLGIYAKGIDTTQVYSHLAPVTLPLDARDTFSEILQTRGAGLGYTRLRKSVNFEVLQAFTPPKVQFFHGGSPGYALTIPYKKDFNTATFTLSTDLDAVGISSSLQHELPTGLASRVLAGKDVPEATAEHVRRQLALQGSPVGTRTSVSASLWRTFLNAVVLERSRLTEAYPTSITYG